MTTRLELMERNQQRVKRLWEWIDRPLSNEFYRTAGRLRKKKLYQERWTEIPNEIKPIAHVLIEAAYKHQKMKKELTEGKSKGNGDKIGENDCLVYRCMVFYIYRKLEKKGINLLLPHYWFTDGVMIEPEWIVSITNGIVGWTCDGSRERCGRYGECRFSSEGK